MGLFDRKRFVVATLLVGIEGPARRAIFDAVAAAQRRIVETDGDFQTTSAELSRIAEILLHHEGAWNHVANWGEVFRKEEDASEYGEESFADCAGRYLSSSDESDDDDDDGAPEDNAAQGNAVVMMTIAYEGENTDLEKTISTRQDLTAALTAIIALHRRDRLLLAHLHQSPGTLEESLTEDQLLVSYPEMISL